MVTFTKNKALGLPVVGGDAGAWGGPLNNNSSTLDQSLGGFVSIPISSVAGALTLLSSNYSNVFLSFTGALTQSTVITLPAVGSFYTVQNFCTNSSAFTVTLATTAAGGQLIGAPPFKQQNIFTDGANVKYTGMHNIGEYWDYAGSSVPNWVSACTVPPYLNCDGSAFSAGTYPYLAVILGATTLPDLRGRVRAYLNQGTGRMTAGGSGVDGNTLLAAGGNELMQSHNHGIADPGHIHNEANGLGGVAAGTGGGAALGNGNGSLGHVFTSVSQTGITINSNGAGGSQNVQPTMVGGITMLRAA